MHIYLPGIVTVRLEHGPDSPTVVEPICRKVREIHNVMHYYSRYSLIVAALLEAQSYSNRSAWLQASRRIEELP